VRVPLHLPASCSSFVPIEETEMTNIRYNSQYLANRCSSFVPIEETEMTLSMSCKMHAIGCSSFVPIEETEM